MKSLKLRYFLNIIFLLSPTWLHAHMATGSTNDVVHGLTHPITGLDHLCAMIAVGLWAAQLGGKALWIVPMTFVSVMGAGGFLGMMHVPIPFIEQGILASVFVFGLLILTATYIPFVISIPLVGLFALFHGYAHGSEMPNSFSGIMYAWGFTLTTMLLHLSGIGLAFLFQRFVNRQFVKTAGIAIISFGLFLLLIP